jgi:hypothetical protein
MEVIAPEIKINYSDKYNPAFVEWVNSINSGFQNKIPYAPFEQYVAQAEAWLKEPEPEFFREDQELEYLQSEIERFIVNTLYFSDKLGVLKDEVKPDSSYHFKASKAQQVLLFLVDAGYSMLIGKGRQIGFTSAMGFLMAKRFSYIKNYYTKFITHHKPKGGEILNDKVKFALNNIQDKYRRKNIWNFNAYKITLSEGGTERAKKLSASTTIEVSAPADDAINGGSPNLVCIDEVGFVDNITTIIREGRPTMFKLNPFTGVRDIVRQFVAWGTASMVGAKVSNFKVEYQYCQQRWDEKDYSYGIIPLFFNAYALPGFTMELYEKEKRLAEQREGADREKAIIQFNQHYPMNVEDMFISGSKTIIPFEQINERILHIRKTTREDYVEPKYGYFDCANGEIDDFVNLVKKEVPIPVFISTRGPEDPRTTVTIFHEPDRHWAWRYYGGTDPINTTSGHSKFASSIWDEHINDVAALINYRRRNFKECYLQAILMNQYYSNTHHKVRELPEANAGDMYLDFIKSLGIKGGLLLNTQLPPKFQSAATEIGIHKGHVNSEYITNALMDFLQNFANSIHCETLFIQLKTFVEKESKLSAKVSWKPESRYDFDDAIDAVIYSYMCARCFKYMPKKMSEEQEAKVQVKFVQDASTGYKIRRARIDGKGRRQYI